MYHSSKVARDRDRLREQVLAGLGWTLHRIWGTDWYRVRPGEAPLRLQEAIEQAIAQGPLAASGPAARAAATPGDLPEGRLCGRSLVPCPQSRPRGRRSKERSKSRTPVCRSTSR